MIPLISNHITKQDFLNYIVCERKLFLFRSINHQPFYKQLDDANLIDDFIKFQNNQDQTNDLFEEVSENEGIYVEQVAKSFFIEKYGVEKCIDISQYPIQTRLNRTQEFLSNPDIKIIFEATFMHKNLICRVDVLEKLNDQYQIIEIKAASKAKAKYFYDIFFQYMVLKLLNLPLKTPKIMHLNKEYTLILPMIKTTLFSQTSNFFLNTSKTVTFSFDSIAKYLEIHFPDFIERISLIKEDQENLTWKNNATNLLKVSRKKENAKITYLTKPDTIFISEACKKLEICEAYSYCLKKYMNVEKNKSIFSLNGIRAPQAISLYQKGNNELAKLDYDVILENDEYKSIGKNNKLYIESFKTNDGIIYDETRLKQYLNKNYQYPIYMLDFEACAFAIPVFENTKPFSSIVFQYSIHVILNNNFSTKKYQSKLEHSNIIHFEYLANLKDIDFRLELISNLVIDLEKFGNGTIVAFHKSYEKSKIKDFILYLQSLTDQTKKIKVLIAKLKIIEQKIIDLKDIFKAEQLYCDQKFHGSFSIKHILPAIAPNFSYQGLNISNGLEASETFRSNYVSKIIKKDNNFSEDKWNQNYQDLLKYCHLDTLAMVVIYEKILRKVNFD